MVLKPNVTSTVKSRKENVQDTLAGPELDPISNEKAIRKVTCPLTLTTNLSGTKRSRVVTSAAFKVIDDEDEPRSSPSTRKLSRAVAFPETVEIERKVLGGMENV